MTSASSNQKPSGKPNDIVVQSTDFPSTQSEQTEKAGKSQSGEHTVAKAVGATGGSVAGAAVGSMVAGKMGAAIGAIGGAIAGAAIGDQAATSIDQQVENASGSIKDAAENVTHQVEGTLDSVKSKINETDVKGLAESAKQKINEADVRGVSQSVQGKIDEADVRGVSQSVQGKIDEADVRGVSQSVKGKIDEADVRGATDSAKRTITNDVKPATKNTIDQTSQKAKDVANSATSAANKTLKEPSSNKSAKPAGWKDPSIDQKLREN
ncbi:MAG: glycine zipper domain-containing protein [Phormidesmis sp.]